VEKKAQELNMKGGRK